MFFKNKQTDFHLVGIKIYFPLFQLRSLSLKILNTLQHRHVLYFTFGIATLIFCVYCVSIFSFVMLEIRTYKERSANDANMNIIVHPPVAMVGSAVCLGVPSCVTLGCSPLSGGRQAAVCAGEACNQQHRVNTFITREFIWGVSTDSWQIHWEYFANV